MANIDYKKMEDTMFDSKIMTNKIFNSNMNKIDYEKFLDVTTLNSLLRTAKAAYSQTFYGKFCKKIWLDMIEDKDSIIDDSNSPNFWKKLWEVYEMSIKNDDIELDIKIKEIEFLENLINKLK